MTDEELIARLRTINKNYEMARGVHVDIRQAADRIEALITARDQHWDSLVHWRKQADDLTGQLAAAQDDAKEAEAYAEELEAKLAKAVEALEYYAVEALPWEADDSLQARKALAEIKGGNDAKSDL